MEAVNYWKILRILTTDTCNFDCVFCHNEGQQEKSMQNYLDIKKLKSIIEAINGRPIKEIQFSGGEPFLNPQTIDMIEWIDRNTDYEIGCATNLSLLNEETILRLSKTRVSLNIQFPAFNTEEYLKITKNDLLPEVCRKLELLKHYNISFNLNYVWMKEDIAKLSSMLTFCIFNSYNLKILPYISLNTLKKNNFKETAINFLSSKLGTGKMKIGGSYRWEINENNSKTIVKYIDSPCFTKDHNTCKNYSELRLSPKLELQTCLLKNAVSKVEQHELSNKNKISDKLDLAWDNFTSC